MIDGGETINVNPAATERRLVVMLLLKTPQIIQKEFYELDLILRKNFPETYWISFRMANNPELMLAFVIDSPKQVASIRSQLISIFEDAEIFYQMIVPQWLYYPDFRNNLIEKNSE